VSRVRLAGLMLLALVVRGPFLVEALRTPVDGDTAIVGLMARHPGVGLTLWGQPYGSPLEAWLAAPLLAAASPTAAPLRIFYLGLGLLLVPAAAALAGALDRRAALPAALLAACPPPYLLLLSVLPPPLYPLSLLLEAAVLVLALRLGPRLHDGQSPAVALAGWGLLSGLALWTHLMSASVVAAAGGYLLLRSRPGLHRLLPAALGLLLATTPLWSPVLQGSSALRAVAVANRHESLSGHLAEVLPQLHRPLLGLLGTHTPLVPDEPGGMVPSGPLVATSLVLVWGSALVFAGLAAGRSEGARLLLASVALGLLAFPFPLRSGPDSIRFLTPLFLPLCALCVWRPASHASPRRAWIVALTLAALHLAGAARLLADLRSADRTKAPFLLVDLAPVRSELLRLGVRHAYASYGPAWRLTYESGERIVASQPWNERFLHHPLPLLDEVRFAKDVAWVLTPDVPTDLPSPRSFEEQMGRIGGTWKRRELPGVVIFHDFEPPFGSNVEPWPGVPRRPDAVTPTVLRLDPPRPLDAVTLLAPRGELRLARSLDIEVSGDGITFEKVAERRRRGEREDLRWVNGQPQYVIDHDLLAVPLHGRRVAAIRLAPYASTDAWGLGAVLLHPADLPRKPWDEWLPAQPGWPERLEALDADPHPDREDWLYRRLLASRER
jgi:hypothetical protein